MPHNDCGAVCAELVDKPSSQGLNNFLGELAADKPANVIGFYELAQVSGSRTHAPKTT